MMTIDLLFQDVGGGFGYLRFAGAAYFEDGRFVPSNGSREVHSCHRGGRRGESLDQPRSRDSSICGTGSVAHDPVEPCLDIRIARVSGGRSRAAAVSGWDF